MPIDREQVEAFHAAAAAVMRDYVGERFAVPARERTTGELLRAEAIVRAVQEEDLALLAQVLRQCDLVKFARYLPDDAARSRLLTMAEQFVAAAAGAAPGGQP
jgi:hypothetical protein